MITNDWIDGNDFVHELGLFLGIFNDLTPVQAWQSTNATTNLLYAIMYKLIDADHLEIGNFGKVRRKS